MNKDQYYVFKDGCWMHRSPIKLLINPCLRKIQFWTNRPYVIASNTKFVNSTPHFINYEFVRIKYSP